MKFLGKREEKIYAKILNYYIYNESLINDNIFKVFTDLHEIYDEFIEFATSAENFYEYCKINYDFNNLDFLKKEYEEFMKK